MGRYYNGDIEGKFWFAVQSSDDGEFFGCEEQEQSHIQYYTEDLKKVNMGVKKCLKELGEFKEKLDKFFKEKDSYNEKMLEKYLKISGDKVNELLKWYARLDLGLKIQKCVKENDSCSFDAEI